MVINIPATTGTTLGTCKILLGLLINYFYVFLNQNYDPNFNDKRQFISMIVHLAVIIVPTHENRKKLRYNFLDAFRMVLN